MQSRKTIETRNILDIYLLDVTIPFVIRSYHQEHRRSHQNSQLKPAWAGLVLGRVISWESPVLYRVLHVLFLCSSNAAVAPDCGIRLTWQVLSLILHSDGADARRLTVVGSVASTVKILVTTWMGL